MSFLTAIGTSVPKHEYSLSDFSQWVISTYHGNAAKRKIQFIGNDAGIAKKHMVIDDFRKGEGNPVLYKKNNPSFYNPSTAERMGVFLSLATDLGAKAAWNCMSKRDLNAKDITHIIAVSCTGMTAPGLEIELFKRLGLSSNCERFAVNFMGCYASFHAFKHAKYICDAQPNSIVLIISVELCSLHFRNDESNDNLLSTVLFADGAAACIMESKPVLNRWHLKWETFSSSLIEQGRNDMGWKIGNQGFEMRLNKNIPKHIKENIADAYGDICRKTGVEPNDIVGYAIHPGGKNILKAFEEAIQCRPSDMQHSYDVLNLYGNMSSATILFVLESILGKDQPGRYYSAAFGPGLTVENGIFVHESA